MLKNQKCDRCETRNWASLTGGVCDKCLALEKRQHATEQGLVICQVSARRWQVVRLNSVYDTSMSLLPRWTYLNGSIVFTGTREDAIAYLKANSKPYQDATKSG